MMNPTQKKQAIQAAMIASITAGKGNWSDLVAAVEAAKVTKTMNGWTLRNCLQTLLDSGSIYRVWFIDNETYDLTSNKPAHDAPVSGWTLADALYKGDMVDKISAADMLNFEENAGIDSATCSLTGITVKIEGAKFLMQDGTDITDLYYKALDAAVGA